MKKLLALLLATLCGLQLVQAQTRDSSFKPQILSAGVPSTGELMSVQPDGKILVMGSFDEVGDLPRDRVARLYPDGRVDEQFNTPSIEGIIAWATTQLDRRILLGGRFTAVDGLSKKGLIRLEPNGQLDESFNPVIEGTGDVAVRGIMLDEFGRILISGAFETVNGVTRKCIARLNENGTLDNTFVPFGGIGEGLSWVGPVALQNDGKMILDCSLGLIRLNEDGAVDSSFAVPEDFDNGLHALAVQPDGKVLVAGNFNTIGGVSRSYLARLNANGSLDSSFDPKANASVYSVSLQADGKIVIGGEFNAVGLSIRRKIARLNGDGSIDSNFNYTINDIVRSIAIQVDAKILVAGDFTYTAEGVDRGGWIRLINNSSPSQSLTVSETNILWQRGGGAPEIEGVVFERWDGGEWVGVGDAVRVDGGWEMGGLSLESNTWVRSRGSIISSTWGSVRAGYVMQINGVGPSHPDITIESPSGIALTSGVASLQFDQQTWLTESPGREVVIRNEGAAPLTIMSAIIDGEAKEDFTIENFNSAELAPGSSSTFTLRFTPKNGGHRIANLKLLSNDLDESPFIVELSGRGIHVDESFLPPSVGVGLYPNFLMPLSDGRFLFGGRNGEDNIESSNKVGVLHSNGDRDTTVMVSVDGFVECAAELQDGLLIAGTFTKVGGVARPYLARINLTNGNLDETYSPLLDGSVSCIVPYPSGKVLLVGNFSSVNGTTRRSVAMLNTDGSLDEAFDASMSTSNAVSSACVQADGGIIIAGSFTDVGGTARTCLARLDGTGAVDPNFSPNISPTFEGFAARVTTAIPTPDGKVLIAGGFKIEGAVVRERIAQMEADGSVDESFLATTEPFAMDSLALQSDGKIIVGGYFKSVNGKARRGIAKLSSDGSLIHDFNPSFDTPGLNVFLDYNGRVLAAGHGGYDTVSGVQRPRMARVQNTPSEPDVLIVEGMSQIRWQRSGSVPELYRVRFEYLDGANWIDLGAATRIPTGWQLSGLALPQAGEVRAIGWSAGGRNNGSSGLFSQRQEFVTEAAPSITSHPQSQSVVLGATATLDVNASGAEPFSYQWRRNGVNISKATNKVLVIPNIKVSQLGSYDVVVKNDYGIALSKPASISLIPAGTVEEQPEDQEVPVGGTAVFVVAVDNATSYQWFRNGAAIKGETSATLTISDVDAAKTGIYSVRVSVPGGYIVSEAAQLRLEDPQLLVYQVKGSGTSHEGVSRSIGSVTGFFVLDRVNQRGGFVWSAKNGKLSTHWTEVHESIESTSTGPVPKSITSISEFQHADTSPESGKSVIWLQGTDAVLSINKLDKTVGPKVLTGIMNSIGFEPTIRIENVRLSLAFDAINTSLARQSDESLEAALSRISLALMAKGSVPVE